MGQTGKISKGPGNNNKKGVKVDGNFKHWNNNQALLTDAFQCFLKMWLEITTLEKN